MLNTQPDGYKIDVYIEPWPSLMTNHYPTKCEAIVIWKAIDSQQVCIGQLLQTNMVELDFFIIPIIKGLFNLKTLYN